MQNPRHKKKVASFEEGQEVQNEYSENEEEDSFYTDDNCSVLFEEKDVQRAIYCVVVEKRSLKSVAEKEEI